MAHFQLAKKRAFCIKASSNRKKEINMSKIIITQSILWAAAIISNALVASSEQGWLLLTVLATIALGTLKNGINHLNS